MAAINSDNPISQAETLAGPPPTFARPQSPTKALAGPDPTLPDGPDPAARPGKRPRLEAPQMTAAAAFAEAGRKTRDATPPSTGVSPNPPHQALNALMGAQENATSKAPLDPEREPAPAPAPAPTTGNGAVDPTSTVSEPLAVVVQNIQHPAPADGSTSGDNHAVQTSPTSLSSLGTLENAAGQSSLTTTVGSPLPLDETARQVAHAAGADPDADPDPDAHGPKAFSYPAPLLQPQAAELNRRGMSLPHSATGQGARSPNRRKHSCPYCATVFTRHHNLKSHLLTHSQEKPYVCATCQSRFRRLHDLKRHTKLHTGERPHNCPKCGRRFARGDALARHNKGPGGCASRRASMGSFAGDDDADADESMDGVVYNEPDSIIDDDDDVGAAGGHDGRPGEKTPLIRRQAPSRDFSRDDTWDDPDYANRMFSSYPPMPAARNPAAVSAGLPPGYLLPRSGPNPPASGPAGAVLGSTTTSPSLPPMAGSATARGPAGPGGGVFAQNPLTESPKPLSPGQTHRGSAPSTAEAGLHPSHSPSLGHHPTASYPRPSGTGSSLSSAPQLPPPSALNPPDARYTLPSQGGPAHPPTQPSGPPTHMSGSGPRSSQSNSLSSHGHASGEAPGAMFNKEERIWAYVTSLEHRMNAMQDEISSLRHQLATATHAAPPPPRL